MGELARRVFSRGACWVFLMLLGVPQLSRPQTQYVQPPAKEYLSILEDPHRISHLQPDKIISALALKPADVVADIGSGSGLFTRLLARKAAWVFAVDIDPDLLRYVAKTSQEKGIENFSTILGREDSPGLPRQSVDLAFICDTLHHIKSRQAYLSNISAMLKPGGRVAILDFEKNWPAGHESLRFSMQDLQKWVAAAGLRKVGEYDFVPDDFFHIYTLR